jgi:anti-anti-sigma regulatory factor
MLHHWVEDLGKNQVKVIWTQVTGPVRDAFYKSGIDDSMQQIFFSSLDAAIKHLEGDTPDVYEEKISNQFNH